MLADILSIACNSTSLDHFAMMKCNFDSKCQDNHLQKVFLCCNSSSHLDLSYSKISGEIVSCILTCNKNLSWLHVILTQKDCI